LGKPIINNLNFDYSIFVSLALIKLTNISVISFLFQTLNSPFIYDYINEIKVGGGTHTYKINIEDLYNFPIPIPPLNEQKRICKTIDKIFKLIKAL